MESVCDFSTSVFSIYAPLSVFYISFIFSLFHFLMVKSIRWLQKVQKGDEG